jgi:hypothetical protein
MAYDVEAEHFEVYHGDTLVAYLSYPDQPGAWRPDSASILARVDCSQTTAYAETMLPYWSTRADALEWIADQLDLWAQDEADAHHEEMVEDNKPYTYYEDYCNDAI